MVWVCGQPTNQLPNNSRIVSPSCEHSIAVQLTKGLKPTLSTKYVQKQTRPAPVGPASNLVRRRCAFAVILPHGSHQLISKYRLTMQYLFSCMPNTLSEIEKTISEQRVGRYLREAKGDKNRALRLYVWNARICEAFYLPGQLVEVAIRNRLHETLTQKYGNNWNANQSFFSPLPDRLKTQLQNSRHEAARDHGVAHTINHVISGLSLGFWCHLLTARFEPILWSAGMQSAFPNIPAQVTRQEVYNKIDQFRTWRNRIAHHGAVFDKRPMKELQNIQELLAWICEETLWFMNETNNVHRSLGRKPAK
jgi:hypothetical protein